MKSVRLGERGNGSRLIGRVSIAAALGLSAASASAQAELRVLDCATTFAKSASEATLVKAFDRANVVSAELDGAEGSTERGTVLFPKDAARRVEIFWHDTRQRRRPATVRVRRNSTWSIAPATPSARALTVGLSLDDVAAINGRPFSLSGFGWDMGGYATDWKGGRLDTIAGGCSLSVRFDPDPKVTGSALDRASGDKPLSSSGPVARAVRPIVSEISLGWPE